MSDLDGLNDPISIPDVVTSEFILAAVRLVQIQNLAIQTMYAVGVEGLMSVGFDSYTAAMEYFSSAPNAVELWGALEHHQDVYLNLFRIAQEEMTR